MRIAALLAILVFAGPAAANEVYKWVDANGVVNYGSRPPATSAAKPKVVEQRVSIVASDPSVEYATEAMRKREAERLKYEERDWERRVKAMTAQQEAASHGGTAFLPEEYEAYFPVGYARSKLGNDRPRVEHYGRSVPRSLTSPSRVTSISGEPTTGSAGGARSR